VAKTFVQLKTAVENVTGTNTETGRYLNDGQIALALLSKRLKRQDVNATDGVIIIPSDCLIIRGVAWKNNILDIYPEEFTPDYGTGTPLWWQRNDNNILLIPKQTGTAKLIYTPRPAEMTQDTDVPELTDADSALIAYAIWQIYVDSEDEEESVFWEAKWLKEQAKWLELDNQQYKQPRRVRTIRWV